MDNKESKKSNRKFYIGIVVGFIVWAIIREFVLPLFSN